LSRVRDSSGGLVVSVWNPTRAPDASGRRWHQAGVIVTQKPSAGLFTYFPDYDGPPLDPINMDYRREPVGTVFQPPHWDRGGGLPGALHDVLPGRFGMAVFTRHFPELRYISPAALLGWFGKRAHSGLFFDHPPQEAAGTMTPERYISSLKDLDAVRGPAIALVTRPPPTPRPSTQDGALYPEGVRPKTILPYTYEMTRFFGKEGQGGRRVTTPLDEERFYSTVSAGGAQPKGFVKIDGHYWLAKFDALGSPIRLEHALLELARATNIEAPRSRIVTLPESGEDVLLIERYDRTPTTRAHRISALTLLGFSHINPEMAAGDVLDLIVLAGMLSGSRNGPEVWDMLRRVLFQVGASVSDNHLRNFEWMINAKGHWVPTPLFDLAPNPKSEFATSLCGLRTQKRILTPDLPAIVARKTRLPVAQVASVCADTVQQMATHLDAVIAHTGLNDTDAARLRQCVPAAHLHALAEQWRAPISRPVTEIERSKPG
jgi:hypothetical protein